MKVLGLILLVLGTLGVAYGGFSGSTDRGADASLGSLEIQATKGRRVNIPLWAGILMGGTGLALARKQ